MDIQKQIPQNDPSQLASPTHPKKTEEYTTPLPTEDDFYQDPLKAILMSLVHSSQNGSK